MMTPLHSMRQTGRRLFLKTMGALGLALGLHASAMAARLIAKHASPGIAKGAIDTGRQMQSPDKIQKTENEWRSELSPEQFRVTRLKGTERPFSGIYNDNKAKGIYECICCGYDLFSSEHKFDSGTGWPSFWRPLSAHSLREDADYSYFMKRVEVLCNRCDAHLGHVFDDGPPPTRLRYCINSVSLNFIENTPAV